MPESAIAGLLLNCFQQIVVINLPDRADRRRGMDAELRKVGLSLDHPRVELFAAARPQTKAGFPSIGAHGAFLSHLGVMERARAQGWSRVLVLEDDMAFVPGYALRLPNLLRTLAARPWAMVYGHAGYDASAHPAPDADGLVVLPHVLNLMQLHFLAIDRTSLAVLIPELHAMLGRNPGSPQGGPMHVDGALNWIRRDRPDLIALAVSPAIASQRASRSDIAPARWFDRMPVVRQLVAVARRMRG